MKIQYKNRTYYRTIDRFCGNCDLCIIVPAGMGLYKLQCELNCPSSFCKGNFKLELFNADIFKL